MDFSCRPCKTKSFSFPFPSASAPLSMSAVKLNSLQDLKGLNEAVVSHREGLAPELRLVIDHTITTPYGTGSPIRNYPELDAVITAGTKAKAGNVQDIRGDVASNRIGRFYTTQETS